MKASCHFKKTDARFNFVEGNNKFGYFWIGRDRLNVENEAMTTKMPQSSFSKNLKLAIGPGAWLVFVVMMKALTLSHLAKLIQVVIKTEDGLD